MRVVLTTESLHAPLTGIGRYTLALAQRLGRQAAVKELLYLSGTGLSAQLPEAVAEGHDSAFTPTMRSELRKRLSMSVAAQAVYTRLAAFGQRLRLSHARPDVVHGTNFWLPKSSAAGVLSVHDLSLYTFPECHPPERLITLIPRLEASIRRATVLLTFSEAVRAEVIRHFSWPESAVYTVPHGRTDSFRPHAATELQRVLGNHQLTPNGYTLFVGTIEPRKNLDTLIDAYEALPPALRAHWPLVVVGGRGWESSHLHARMSTAMSRGWLRYLGYAPERALPALFAGARLFVFPSHYEGFGLPVLEAMASGTPVVCSDVPALMELVGDAALCAPAADQDGLRRRLEQGLSDEVWRDRARSMGLTRAAHYDWERSAQQTTVVYRRALGECGGL
jgi:glycosyltransferase involved in cell wall biosynthesis